MRWTSAIWDGLKCGRGGLLSAGLFYGAGLALSTLALTPLAAGLHRALDGAPTAGPIARGAGLDLLAETLLNQPGLWAAGFGAVRGILLLHLLVALVLTAGAFGLAAGCGSRDLWRNYGRSAVTQALPFAGLLALNALLWGVVALVPGLTLFGLSKALKGSDSPVAFWGMVWAALLALYLLLALFKASLGFGQARRVLAGSAEGFGHTFLRSVKFSLRRFAPAFGITTAFMILRVAAAWLLYLGIAPGFGTAGKAVLSALLLQAMFAAQAYIRAAEIGAQTFYCREEMEFPEVKTAEAVPPALEPREEAVVAESLATAPTV